MSNQTPEEQPTIKFYIDNDEFTVLKGTTWEEFAKEHEGEYILNNGEFFIIVDNGHYKVQYAETTTYISGYVTCNDDTVYYDDIIIENGIYKLNSTDIGVVDPD